MSFAAMPARYIHHIATVLDAGAYWRDEADCPADTYFHEHTTRVEMARSNFVDDPSLTTVSMDYRTFLLSYPEPLVCENCGRVCEDRSKLDMWSHKRNAFDTASGRPEPGDIYLLDRQCATRRQGHCVHGWTNCDGIHLMAVCPDGSAWDTNGRANNCTMKDDMLHRCWIRHGDPSKGELVTVNKNGLTCQAGAGSIIVSGYHGFLYNSAWTAG